MPVYKRIIESTPKVSPGSIENVSSTARITDLNLRYDVGVRTMTFYGMLLYFLWHFMAYIQLLQRKKQNQKRLT